MLFTYLQYGVDGQEVEVFQTELTLKEVWVKFQEKTYKEDEEFLSRDYPTFEEFLKQQENETSFKDHKIKYSMDEFGEEWEEVQVQNFN